MDLLSSITMQGNGNSSTIEKLLTDRLPPVLLSLLSAQQRFPPMLIVTAVLLNLRQQPGLS